jgi:hypothetical protein
MMEHTKRRLREVLDEVCAGTRGADDAYTELVGLVEKIGEQAETIEKLKESLIDMVAQHCKNADGTLDSYAESGPAEAMRMLADMGVLTIAAECGRRVVAKWTEGNNP